MEQSIFKAYDIRGIYPQQIDEEGVTRIGQAYVEFLQNEGVKKVVVGCDVRTSSPQLKQALIEGITSAGVQVIDIGTISTDMMYFAVVHLAADGGIAVSASHNPAEYNGMKMVRRGAVGISGDTGLNDIRDRVFDNRPFSLPEEPAIFKKADVLEAYVQHVRKFVEFDKLSQTNKRLKVLVNGNFGLGAKVAQKVAAGLSIDFVAINAEPDGTFPKGAPDPMKDYNREEMKQEIQKAGVDFAVAWDADADRVFFYTGRGEAIEGYFTGALLDQIMLRAHSGENVLYDPRLVWANEESITDAGGKPICARTGHMFIKERMRKENALFASEMSAHYYFRDNFYADNGMIPFLLVVSEILTTGKTIEELVEPWTSKYFTPGEINFKVTNAAEIIEKAEQVYGPKGKIDKIDGLSVNLDDWRFNLRMSNTEPLLRLNLESKVSQADMEEKLSDLKQFIETSFQ